METRKHRFYVTLGANLREARKSKGLTLQEVSDRLNRGISTISDNELGKSEIPFSVIMEYCELYDVSIEDVTPEF